MNKKKVITGSIAAVCAAAAIGGGVWYSNNNKTAKERAEVEKTLEKDTAEQTTIAVEVPTENQSEGVYEIKNTPSEEAVDDVLYSKIASLNTAAKSYFDSNRTDLICTYGLMYSDKDNCTVTASAVAKSAGITVDGDIDSYADVMLIKPADLSDYDGIKLKKTTDKDLKPFIAYNTSQGYIISSVDDKGGILTKDQYRELLGKYAADHGTVRTPESSDEDYMDISASAASALADGGYDIKYLACDDKYAVVVIGGTTTPNNIKEYVLIKKSGGWSIIKDGLETSSYPRAEVNNDISDMELGLLPPYTIAKYGDIKTGFVSYEQTLIKLGMITEEDMPETYSCGAGRFAYLELKSGKKLLGIVNSENKLEFYEVKSVSEAISAMTKTEAEPPTFILHFAH